MASTDRITIDEIIDDCSVSPEAAQALADCAGATVPPGRGQDGPDNWAMAQTSARAIARLLAPGDTIGYATRDALPEATWDDLRRQVRLTDDGSGMVVE